MIKSYAPSGVDLDLDQLYDIIDELEIEEYDKDIAKHHARIDAMKAQEYDFYKDTGQLHLLSYGGKNRYSPPQSYITDKVTAVCPPKCKIPSKVSDLKHFSKSSVFDRSPR